MPSTKLLYNDREALVPRAQYRAVLAEHFPHAPGFTDSTIRTLCQRRLGPPEQWLGRRPVSRVGEIIDWYRGRLRSEPSYRRIRSAEETAA